MPHVSHKNSEVIEAERDEQTIAEDPSKYDDMGVLLIAVIVFALAVPIKTPFC